MFHQPLNWSTKNFIDFILSWTWTLKSWRRSQIFVAKMLKNNTPYFFPVILKGSLSRYAKFRPSRRHGLDITFSWSEWCICRHCRHLTRFFGVVLTRNRKKGKKNNSERPCTDIKVEKNCVGNILIKKGVKIKLSVSAFIIFSTDILTRNIEGKKNSHRSTQHK